jgi:4-hydroxy-4-methyl-2-oxoglutarate aldolase
MLADEVLRRLGKYDTPTICNVLELFDIRPRDTGYTDARIRACFPTLPPMVGYAATVTFRASRAPAGQTEYVGLAEQVARLAELPRPAVVVFQDLDQPSVAATFGEVMCATYKAFGAAGLVTSGTGRDLEQVEALRFPCFTAGTVASHGYCRFEAVDVPVEVGGLPIRPGDLLHGDRNGITSIPVELAEAVADACPEFAAAEAFVLDYLKLGRPTAVGYAEARRACQEAIARLASKCRTRVSRVS